ncbi:MAG TPA: prepilin-type N-terminal cleavage/methylation domain-containing protein [Planctomycetota bacterium]|nr:prepilin-type N-terminal cleavage/methylation domain-containing protein [Planctomycetota bacterium]
MTDKRGGFTLVELIVVISIIMVLAAMIIPGLTRGQYLTKKAATKSEISSMETSLALYESDYGAYPTEVDGNSSRALVDALKGNSKSDEGQPRRKAYYPFKAKQIVDGEYYSVFNKPFYYRENASEQTKDDTIMKNPDTFDIWTSDGKKTDDGINNWD